MAAAPGRPARASTIAKLLLALLATGVLAAGFAMPAVLGAGLLGKHYSVQFLDTSCNLEESKAPEPTTMYANDGKTVIASLFTQDRKGVKLDQVPQYLQDALIATEDRRFYSHHGVDLRGLIRSAVSTSSGDTQGGSTLTMQYVKQIRYYQAGDNKKKQDAAIAQNLQRKMEDARCALDIEGPKHESKKTILEKYLNIAFFGEHAYGIEVAAETYFGKSVSQLTLAQSALLVGLLRAPSAYDPFQYPAAAKARRDEVLQNLVDVGKLSQTEADRQKATPISLATTNPPIVRQGCANSSSTIPNVAFFCEYAQNWLEHVDGINANTLQTGGLKIVTTLDPKIQTDAQNSISKSVPATSPMTAVLPVIDPKTSDITAMAASKTYGAGPGQTEQQIFTNYTANGASTYKLFPLLAALQTGVPDSWQLKTVGNDGVYKSQNCLTPSKAVNGDEQVSYPTLDTLRGAAAKSSNTYFVALADKLLDCHLEPVTDLMRKLGMKGMDQPSDTANQTWAQLIDGQQRAQQLVLGSVPTSPLELAGAYAAIANGGVYIEPAPIRSITNAAGSAVIVKRPAGGVQVVAPQVAAQAVDILVDDTKAGGTSASAFADWYGKHTSKIAGKTGTNESSRKNKNSSVWFVGMTRDLTGALALINFDQSSAPSSGLRGEKTGAAYGAYASKLWLRALRPTLASTSWSWPDANSVAGQDVTDVVGKSLSDAEKDLEDQGFKVQRLDALDDLHCPAKAQYDTVGYYGPHRAEPGSTITVCLSSQVPAYTPPPPVKKKKQKPQPGAGRGAGRGGTGQGGTGQGGTGQGGTGGGQGGGNGQADGGQIGGILPNPR